VTETPLININANFLRASAICQSSETVRYYINCIRIEPHPDEGALLISTDGHRLLVIHDKTAFCRKAISITLDKVALAQCKPQGGIPPRLLVAEDGIARIGETYQTPASVIARGDFCEWQRVVPVQRWLNAPASPGRMPHHR
jgi:hypothetical protein